MKNNKKWQYSFLTVNHGEQIHLLAKLVSPEKESSESVTPINLCLVIDCSGSMYGRKLMETMRSVGMIIANLENGDFISVVTFSDNVNTLIPPQKITSDRSHLLEAVKMVHASGSTNLSGGLLLGMEHLARSQTEDSINRLLILTDGCANRGITHADKLVSLTKSARQQNDITTTTLGFGLDFNEDLLIGMANSANGNFYFIQNADDAPKMFSEELHGIQQVVAQNIVAEIIPNEKFVNSVDQISSYPYFLKENNLSIEMGDAYAGEEKKILVSLNGKAIEKLKDEKLAEIKIRMTEIGEEKIQSKEIVQAIFLSDTAGDGETKVEVLQELALQESVKERSEAMEDMGAAIKHADAKSAEKAAKRLKSVADKLEELPDDVKNEVIENEIKELREQAEELLNAAQKSGEDLMGKTMKIRKLTATSTQSIARSKLNKHLKNGSIKDKAFKKMMDKLDKKDQDGDKQK